MIPDSNLTCNHQTARRRSSTNYTSCRSLTSPRPSIGAPTPQPATSTRSQDLPLGNLFATLLFDRQKAYQIPSRVSLALPLAPVADTEKTKSTERHTGTQVPDISPIPSKLHVRNPKEARHSHSDISLPSYLKPLMVSKAPTSKNAGNATAERPNKRAAPARVTSRTTKCQKTKANSKKKIDNKGSISNNIMTALSAAFNKGNEIITISDSEDDAYQPMWKGRLRGRDGEDAELDASKTSIHEEEDVKPNISTLVVSPEPIELTPTQSPSISLDQVPRLRSRGINPSESDSDLHPTLAQNHLQNEMVLAEKERTKEKEQILQELNTAKAELDRLKILHEKEKSDSVLEQVRSSNKTSQDMQKLRRDLEAEREKIQTVTRERYQLRIDIDNCNAAKGQLAQKLQEERVRRDEEKKEHERILEDVMKTKEALTSDPSNDHLVTENRRLQTENESLRAAVASARAPPTPRSASPLVLSFPSSQPSQSSSYPSIFASQTSPSFQPPSPPASSTNSSALVTTNERKEENVRRTYIKLKRRFDNLHSAAGSLANSTRGMDLSSFGQFGKHLRQLRAALDEPAYKKEDDDVK